MNFFIHIGIHKTGSTALQYFCLKNRLKLQELGFFYPEIGLKDAGHHTIAWLAKNKDKSARLHEILHSIKEEARRAGCENIILSSEEFEFLRDLHMLSAALQHDHCKIIMFLRRQDSLLESEYNQHVKMFSTKYRHDIFKFHFDHDFSQRFNYKYLCNIWRHKFSDDGLSIISYDYWSKQPNGIFNAFLATLGLSLHDNFMMPEERHSNISLPNKATLYLARLNQLSLTKEQHQLAIRLLTTEFSLEKNQPLLSMKDRHTLWKRYKGTNDFVEKNFNTACFIEPEKDANAEVLASLNFCTHFNRGLYARIKAAVLTGEHQ
ncbi:MAG: hypothetical protein LAC70_08105 [Methylovulum sp.]|jgi:hypothetical protein|nr:hypothetical protein [Methylovulum sp.]TSA41313.1 MAG: hypothetical protein D4R63_03565 [Methylococcaceae bacterium]